MKLFQKVCALCLSLTVLIGAVPLKGTFASAAEANQISVVKDSNVMLDGALDEEVWQPLTPVAKQIVGDTDTINAGFNVTWDNSNLYVGVQVTAKTEDKTSFNKDSISVYLAPKNNRGSYSKDDFQLQISNKGTTVTTGYAGSGKNSTLKVSEISTKYQPIEKGYTMEIEIPWTVVGFVPQGTSDMGFDLMAFDGDAGNVLVWSGDSDNWTNTSHFGTLTFTSDGTEPNGQALTMDRTVYASQSDISVHYSKGVSGDAVGIISKGAKPSEEDPIWSHAAEGAGTATYSADENNLESGDYDVIFYNTDNKSVYVRKTVSIGEVKVYTDQGIYAKADQSDITVHFDHAADGSWIGLYFDNDTPGDSTSSIAWKYTGASSGEITFTQEDIAASGRLYYNGKKQDYLRTGDYKVILFADGGYTIDQVCPFSVTGAEFTLDKTSFSSNFQINLDYSGTDAENNKDWVGIFDKNTVPSSSAPLYAYKYAAGDSGSLTFTQDDVKDYPYSPLNGQALPSGEYEIALLANDGYDVLDSAEFTVVDTAAYPPAAVSYKRTGNRVGYADGRVVITNDDHESTLQYNLYWGDENGKLNGFDKIDTVKKMAGGYSGYTMVANTFIPAQATRLLVYGVSSAGESDTPAYAEIPASAKFPNETPLYTYNVISDTHITTWDSSMNKYFDLALKDIKQNDPNSSGIFIDGDMVDSGLDENYAKFFSILDANKAGLPNIYYAIGNHEFMETTNVPYGHPMDGKLQKWLDNTKEPNIYYDQYINGQHFIVMGSEQSVYDTTYQDDDCYISETQFNWLRQKLAETKNKKEPIFLFLHQSMSNTVAGSIGIKGTDGAQGWYGMKPEQEEELRSILKGYPQVVLFNGHSHWVLESKYEMYDGKNTFASIFNTASAGSLWSDAGETIDGSQGLYVEVYKDKVLVKGRSFSNGNWIPKAFFSVDLNEKFQSASSSGGSSGGAGGSGSNSSGVSSSTGSPSSGTVTKVTDGSGALVSVTTKPDTVPVVSGTKSSVSVSVPQDAVSNLASATAQKPVILNIIAPESALLEQLNSSSVHSVDLSVKVPAEAINSANASAKVSIVLPSSVLQSAKTKNKDILLQVVNAQTGAMAYSWSFSGAALGRSVSSVIPINTSVTVNTVQSNAQISQAVAAGSADRQASGTVIQFAENGLLPAPASVRVYVGNQANCGPNSKVYLYYHNSAVNSLEKLPKQEYTVDAQGYLNFTVAHNSSFVVLPKAATTPYPVQSDTTYPVGVKNSNTYTFTMTVSGNVVPTFTTGNGKIFTNVVKRQGNRYYVTVKAVGKKDEMTALYCTVPGKKAIPMCYLAIS